MKNEIQFVTSYDTYIILYFRGYVKVCWIREFILEYVWRLFFTI